jgi:hypothetical protein
MDTVVTELIGEGMQNAWAVMINHPLARGQGYRLAPYNALIPALQDTFTTIYGGATPAVGALLNCLDPYVFLVVDEGGYSTRRTVLGEGVDLRVSSGRATVEQWMRDVAGANPCGGATDQYPEVETLTAECATAGVAVRSIVVTPWADACLRRALQAAGSSLAVLQDEREGLFSALGARRGELMLLDTEGRIRRRMSTGAGIGRDVDLTQPAVRAQVIQWLQEFPPTP